MERSSNHPFVEYVKKSKYIMLGGGTAEKARQNTFCCLHGHYYSVGDFVHCFRAYVIDFTGQKREYIIRYYLIEQAACNGKFNAGSTSNNIDNNKLNGYLEQLNETNLIHIKLTSPKIVDIISKYEKGKSPNGQQFVEMS